MDDRKKFLKNIKFKSLSLGKNPQILKKSMNFLIEVDKYDYSYLWTWFGVPIIQLPSDIIVAQEIIFKTKPDVIIETGIARGGSLIFYASILKLIKKDFKIIGVDIDIKLHNKKSILSSKFSKYIKLIEGSSVSEDIFKKVKKIIPKKSNVMVILDSNHTKKHVMEECKLYGTLVTKNNYMVVADSTIGYLKNNQIPKKRSIILKNDDNPNIGIKEFLKFNKKFQIDKELNGKLIFSSNFNGYLKKIKK